jgi:CheY-like chemotaxis protein
MSLHDLLAGRPCDGSLRGRRVLIVEDDYLIAEDLREQLLSCGAVVLGPVACVADALALLEDGAVPDMAILDIGLGGGKVYPVADALRRRGIPFVFATGYDSWSIPSAYADVPRTEKPVALRGAPLAR